MKNEEIKNKILITSDHAGFELKEELTPYITGLGYHVEDRGPSKYHLEDDYPDFIVPVAGAVSRNEDLQAIVIGGSGQGEAIVANRFKNVRAVVYNSPNLEIIKLSREHNDANVLSLGARFLSIEDAKEAVELWLQTEFSNEKRHLRRTGKIDKQDNLSKFDQWNGLKQKINNKKVSNVFFHEKEIWWCTFGKNIGFEEDGKSEYFSRPILILKKFNQYVFLGVALTTKDKKGKYYMEIDEIDGVKNVVILSQIRLFDRLRLIKKIKSVDNDIFEKVTKNLKENIF